MRRIILLAAFLSLANGGVWAADSREPLSRTPEERDWMLGQMRLFLEAIHGIADGLARHDAAQVAESAAARGRQRNPSFPDRPATLPAKETDVWKGWVANVRTGFDALAAAARAGEPAERQLAILGDITANCAQCHGTYRIETSP